MDGRFDDDLLEIDDDEYDSKEEEDDGESIESNGSNFSDMFSSLNLMSKISKFEEAAEQQGVLMNEDSFYANMEALNQFIDKRENNLWKCNVCDLWNNEKRLRCQACFEFCDLMKEALSINIIIVLMSYLDGTSLINLYLSNICDICSDENYEKICRFIRDKITTHNVADISAKEQALSIPNPNSKSFGEWKSLWFERLNISHWNQPKSDHSFYSFHRVFLPFNLEKINDALKFVFESETMLKRIDVYGFHKNQTASLLDLMIVKNKDYSNPLHVQQFNDIQYKF